MSRHPLFRRTSTGRALSATLVLAEMCLAAVLAGALAGCSRSPGDEGAVPATPRLQGRPLLTPTSSHDPPPLGSAAAPGTTGTNGSDGTPTAPAGAEKSNESTPAASSATDGAMFEPPQARSIGATNGAFPAGGRDARASQAGERDARASQAGTAGPAAVDATTSPDAAQDVPADDVDDRGGEYQPVTFAKLAGFAYDQYAVEESLAERGDGTVEDQIPAAIRALSGRKVAVRGFMVPIEFTRNETRSFLLVRNRMVCCFGMLVGLNEWIYVRMKPDRVARWLNDIPVTVYGTLTVGEDIKDGMVLSVYRMEGDDVVHQGGY